MSKSFTFVVIFVALFFGGVAGYFLRDAQVAEEKIKLFNRMPAPAAGMPSVSSLVPERASKEFQVLSNCGGLINCEARRKDGAKVLLRVVKEGGELSVLIGEAKLSWGVFVKALKNKEFDVPDFEMGRYTVEE